MLLLCGEDTEKTVKIKETWRKREVERERELVRVRIEELEKQEF